MPRSITWRTLLPAALLVAVTAAVGVGRAQPGDVLPPGTVALDVAPHGVAVDARIGRAFIANAGLGGSGHTLSVLDTHTGRLVGTIAVGQGPSSMAVNERTGRLFVADGGFDDRTGHHGSDVAVVETRTGRVLHRVLIKGYPGQVTIDALTGRAVVPVYGTTPGATVLVELDARDGHVTSTMRGDALLAGDRSTGHTFVATSGAIVMFDARRGTLVRTIPLGASFLPDVGSGAVDPHTGRLFVADYTARRVFVLDTRGGALLRTVSVGTRPLAVVADPATARVFVLGQGTFNGADQPTNAGTLSVLDARTGTVLHTVTLDLNAVTLALDARRGLVFATATGPTRLSDGGPSRKGKLFVLDARSGVVRRIVTVGVGPYTLAEDSRAGRVFVVNGLGEGGSYNESGEWYLRLLPHHNPRGSVSIVDLTR